MMRNQRLPLVTVISVFSKHCPWTSEASWRTLKSKLQAWCIRISGRGDGKMAIFLNFKNHSPRILNIGPKIPDLSINNQQWTFKYFSENSSTLIKEKKMRKRLHRITYPASRQYIITLKVLVTYIHLLLLFTSLGQRKSRNWVRKVTSNTMIKASRAARTCQNCSV